MHSVPSLRRWELNSLFLGYVLCFGVLFQRAEDLRSLEKTKLEGPSVLENPGLAMSARRSKLILEGQV